MGLLLTVVLVGLAGYGALAGGLYLAQDRLIFPRHLVPATAEPPPAGSAHERLELRTPEGHRLVGTLVRARRPAGVLLLAFAGNASNAGDFAFFLARRLPDLDVAVFHYRGYAPSEGRPGEAALAADAVAAYDHLVASLRPRRILLGGFSIGSGVAAALAEARRADGLLLVTPFDSVEAVARGHYPWLPVGLLLRHRFRSDLRLAGLDTPTAVIAASDDTVVPRRNTEALVRVLRRPVLVETVPGSTHNGIYGMAEIDVALRRAVDALLDAVAADEEGLAPASYQGAG